MDQEPTGVHLLDYLDEFEGLSPEACEDKLRGLPLEESQKETLRRCLAAREASRRFMVDAPTLVGGVMGSDGAESRRSTKGRGDKNGNQAWRIGFVGMAFGKYRLHQYLASGTFGEVWSAKHHWLDTQDTKPTCLKLLYPENTRLEAALDEARVMAAVHHPNVVAVKEVDCVSVDGKNIWYIEMELVGAADGEIFTAAPSLQVFGARDGRPLRAPLQAARIMLDVCAGVHAAHQRRLVHRDLKPENILLNPQTLQAKVTDFGIAGSLGPSGDGGREAKSRVRSLGTPAYMAPEQAQGDITIQSDIYSLGAILYFLLAGHPPYSARTGLTGTAAAIDILDQIRSGAGPIPLPDDRRIPPTLRAICDKAMARNLSQRYASASEMAKDIHAWLDHRPTSAYPLTPIMAAGLLLRRYPKEAAFTAAMILLAVAGIAFYVYRINIEKRLAQREATLARLAAVRALAAKRRALHEAAVADRERRQSLRSAYRANIADAENATIAGQAGAGKAALRRTPPLDRGWEFNYLWRMFSCSAYQPELHDPVIAMRWAPDRNVLEAYTDLRRILISPDRLPHHRIAISGSRNRGLLPTMVRYDPVGDLAAGVYMADYVYQVGIFNTRTLRPVALSRFDVFTDGRSRLPPFAWSPHGHLLAMLGPLGTTVRFCRVPSLQPWEIFRLPQMRGANAHVNQSGKPFPATTLEWLKNGVLVAINGNYAVSIEPTPDGSYHVVRGGWMRMFRDDSLALSAVVNPDQPCIAFGLSDGNLVVKYFQQTGGSRKSYFYIPTGGIPLESVAWSPHGSSILAGNRAGLIGCYTFNPARAARNKSAFLPAGGVSGIAGPVLRLSVSGDGRHIAALDRLGRLYIWKRSQFNLTQPIPAYFLPSAWNWFEAPARWPLQYLPGEEDLPTEMQGLSIGQNIGSLVAFGGRTAPHVWSVFTLNAHKKIVRQIFAGIKGMWLSQLCWGGNTLGAMYHRRSAGLGGATRLVFFKVGDGAQVVEEVSLPRYFNSPSGLAMSMHGNRWANVSGRRLAWGYTGVIRAGKAAGSKSRTIFTGLPTGDMGVAAWTGQSAVVCGGLDGERAAIIFVPLEAKVSPRTAKSLKKNQPQRPILLDRQDWVTAVAADPQIHVIWAGTNKGYIWQIKQGQRPILLKSTPGSPIEGIALNAAINRFAGISESGEIRIWKLGGRHPVLTISNLHVRGHDVAWCGTNRLVVASSSPMIYILDGRPVEGVKRQNAAPPRHRPPTASTRSPSVKGGH